MAILNQSNLYTSGESVTAANLNALIGQATFSTNNGEAVDGSTLQVHSTDGYLMVKDGGLSAAKFAPGAVDSAIGTGGISATELASDAVTTAKIKDSTGASDGVTTAKLATGAVTTAKIADDAVTSAKISDSDSVFSVNDSTGVTTAGGTFVNSKSSTSTENNITVYNADASAGESRLRFHAPNVSSGLPTECIFGFQPNPGQISITIADGAGGYKSLALNKAGTVSCPGDLGVVGALSKGSGSFKIDHPLKPNSHHLVHSFVESPQADLIYRGKINLVNGSAQANIDTVSGMTEGTFDALCGDVQCFTSNESGWSSVKGNVVGNIITINCENANSDDLISWMVVGERKDQHMLDTDWTDENGKVIVEPIK